MKAVTIHQYGDPDVLTIDDLPMPQAGVGEVMVRVHATGVNPIDCKTRAGSGLAGRYGENFPLILGWDISGVVEAVGANVTRFQVGDAVYGMVNFPDLANAYAEYVVSPEAHLSHKPAALSHIEAAAVPLVALTAWQGLFEYGDLQAGQRVLIHAAAGGVGHVAVQLAKWRGASVIGTASTEKVDFVRGFGADEVIDYTQVEFEDVVRDIDLCLSGVGDETQPRTYEVLKPDGKYISIVGLQYEDDRAERMLVRPVEKHLQQITTLLNEDQLKVHVSAVFPLEQTQRAHELVETGHVRGKVVLQVV